MNSFVCRVSARFVFDAAHRMPNFPPDHPNAWLHGHSYTGDVVIEGPVDQLSGFVMDHGKLDAIVNKVAGELEHRYLNEIEGMGLPTSENICRWMWQKLKPELPLLVEIAMRRESRGICVTYRGPYKESSPS